MNWYSILFNTMCIYFMVSTAPRAKASRHPSIFMATCFSLVLAGNIALLDFPVGDAALRGAAIATVFVFLYWILISAAKPRS